MKKWFCTMKTNTHITGGKWPKLEEALKHFCGRELGSFAHDAMYDVKACRDIFFAMKHPKHFEPEECFLFIDTETTGFPKGKEGEPLAQEGQARVCQVAMLLTDNTGRPISEFSGMIKPDGWCKIDEGAQKAHGFTVEHCEKYGMNFRAVVNLYRFMVERSTTIIAHNTDFDRKMMNIELAFAELPKAAA